jgi:hypothetical protein
MTRFGTKRHEMSRLSKLSCLIFAALYNKNEKGRM